MQSLLSIHHKSEHSDNRQIHAQKCMHTCIIYCACVVSIDPKDRICHRAGHVYRTRNTTNSQPKELKESAMCIGTYVDEIVLILNHL